MEQMDRLWPGGPVFYYDDALFKPGTDAFLLGAFARPRAGDRVCDLGPAPGSSVCCSWPGSPPSPSTMWSFRRRRFLWA